MPKITKPRPVFVDPAIHKVLEAKSLISGLSIEDLVNQALCCELLEDLREMEKSRLKTLLKSDFLDGARDLQKNGLTS